MHYLETVERWCIQAGAGRVAPTVLALLGIEQPTTMTGHSLLSLARAPS